MKLYHGDSNYAFPDNGIVPEMIAEMDPDEFAEDPDPEMEDLKARQGYLEIDQRISDIMVGPPPAEEEDWTDHEAVLNWELNGDGNANWDFQQEGSLDPELFVRPGSPVNLNPNDSYQIVFIPNKRTRFTEKYAKLSET